MSVWFKLDDAALDRLDKQAEESAECSHMKPVSAAVRAGCELRTVAHHRSLFLRPQQGLGDIVIVEDDTKKSSNGPWAFHGPTIARLARRADTHAILSLAPCAEVYAKAADDALKGAVALIVETSPWFELPWLKTILIAAPGRTVVLDPKGPFGGAMR